MAEITNRNTKNAPGRFYVDDSCIDCDLCRSEAPAFFRRDDNTGFTIVQRQPVTPEEKALAADMVDQCPTNSIGDDGTEVSQS